MTATTEPEIPRVGGGSLFSKGRTMSAYTDAVERGLKGLEAPSVGMSPGCPQCEELRIGDELIDEGSFSWSGCGICGSSLGGDRYVWHWLEPHREEGRTEAELHHEDDACADCVMYLANGDEPEQWEG